MSPLDEGTFCYGSDQVVADFVARELFDSKKNPGTITIALIYCNKIG